MVSASLLRTLTEGLGSADIRHNGNGFSKPQSTLCFKQKQPFRSSKQAPILLHYTNSANEIQSHEEDATQSLYHRQHESIVCNSRQPGV